MASTNSSPLTPLRLRVGTRTTPEKRQHGGARSNSGVKGQENISPSVSEIRSMAVKVHFENDRKEKDFLISQKQLSNPQGRSWPEEECKLLLMLILSCMHFYQMTQTDAINEVAKLVRRSYRLLLTMWRKWQDEEVVYVVDTSDRGGGSIHHINNTHRITTDMVTEITSCIYTMNTGGTGVTTTEIKSHLFNTLGVKIAARTLRDVLHKMGYKYGVSTVIGKMNDKWRRDRIRYFLLEYSRALRDQAAGTHVLSIQMRLTSTQIIVEIGPGSIQTMMTRSTWSSPVVRGLDWSYCTLLQRTVGLCMTPPSSRIELMKCPSHVNWYMKQRTAMGIIIPI